MAKRPTLVPVPDCKNTFEQASPEQAERMEALAQGMLLSLNGVVMDEGFSAIACVVAVLARSIDIKPELVEAFARGTFADAIILHYERGAGDPEVQQ